MPRYNRYALAAAPTCLSVFRGLLEPADQAREEASFEDERWDRVRCVRVFPPSTGVCDSRKLNKGLRRRCDEIDKDLLRQWRNLFPRSN